MHYQIKVLFGAIFPCLVLRLDNLGVQAAGGGDVVDAPHVLQDHSRPRLVGGDHLPAVLTAPVLVVSLLLVDVRHVELENVDIEEGFAAVFALHVEHVRNWLPTYCHVQNSHLLWDLLVNFVHVQVSFGRRSVLCKTKLAFQLILDRILIDWSPLDKIRFSVCLDLVIFQNIFVYEFQITI